MIYERTMVYRISAETHEDAAAIWDENGPKVWEGGGVVIHDASQLELADMLAGHGVLTESESQDA
jgi:hypothetical protein